MKKILLSAISLLALLSCTENNPEAGDIKVDFSISKTSVLTGEPVKFTPSVSGGTAPYTYSWDFSDGLTSSEESPEIVYGTAGVKVVSLTVTDSRGIASLQPKSRTLAVTEAPVEDTGDISIAWYVDFGDATGGVRGSSPAVDDAGNIYIAGSVSDNGSLHKVSPEGSLLKTVAISAAPGNTCMSPSIDSEGNVYVGGGSGSGGSFHKYGASLNDLWSGEFWNKGEAASPKIWYGAAVILDNHVLVANAGSTGTVGALSKADGKRVSYVTSGDGGGPSGGCRQSPVVSADGYVWQVCAANGIIGMTRDNLLAQGAVAYEYFADNVDGVDLKSTGSDRPAHAAVTAGGQTWLAGAATVDGGNAHVYLLSKDGASAKEFVIDGTNTSIANTTQQDQGGVIIGADNEVIVNLKAGAVADGGIVAVDPSTMTLAWEYRIPESVSGAPALTKEGNVVFGTDNGTFYIIKPAAGTAELVAKADINELIREAGMTPSQGFEEVFNIKMWSSVTIGDDGKMYIGFQKNDSSTASGLLCLESSAVTGPGTSSWPMFGVDRRHTGVQKEL